MAMDKALSRRAQGLVRLSYLFIVGMYFEFLFFLVIGVIIIYRSQVSHWLVTHDVALAGIGAIATGIAAFVGAFGLVVAAVGALAVRSQVEQQWKISREQSSRECLWRFTDQWAREILKKRHGSHRWGRALEALATESWKHAVSPPGFIGEWNRDVVAVLNFFESVAFMCYRGDLDMELSWTAFSDTALELYKRSQSFVSAYREGRIKRQPDDVQVGRQDLSFWENFDPWVLELSKYQEFRNELRQRNPDYVQFRKELSKWTPSWA